MRTTSAALQSGYLLDGARELMQEWADMLDEFKKLSVGRSRVA